MARATALLTLLGVDAVRVVRDRFLIAMAVYLLGVSAAMRWILPALASGLRTRSGFELEPLYPLLVSYFTMILGPLAIGVVGGMLLLETREDRTVEALLVSPLPLRTYLSGYSAAVALGGAFVAVTEAAAIGLGLPPWRALVPLSVVAGLGAPMVALYLATFAGNKVEAFAQMKVVGAAGLVPVGAWLVPVPWQYAACLFPPFWPVKAWWMAQSGAAGWTWWIGGGAVVSGLALYALMRRFQRLTRVHG